MMMEGINSDLSTSAVSEASARPSDYSPPSGAPVGTPEAQPDVSVVISDAAAARLEAMMAPAEHSSDTIKVDGGSGMMNFGVEMGGFDWPLNAGAESTIENEDVSGDKGWTQSSEPTSVTGVAASSESAYLALGKSTVSSAE